MGVWQLARDRPGKCSVTARSLSSRSKIADIGDGHGHSHGLHPDADQHSSKPCMPLLLALRCEARSMGKTRESYPKIQISVTLSFSRVHSPIVTKTLPPIGALAPRVTSADQVYKIKQRWKAGTPLSQTKRRELQSIRRAGVSHRTQNIVCITQNGQRRVKNQTSHEQSIYKSMGSYARNKNLDKQYGSESIQRTNHGHGGHTGFQVDGRPQASCGERELLLSSARQPRSGSFGHAALSSQGDFWRVRVIRENNLFRDHSRYAARNVAWVLKRFRYIGFRNTLEQVSPLLEKKNATVLDVG